MRESGSLTKAPFLSSCHTDLLIAGPSIKVQMPVTPLHAGPGVLLKSFVRSHMSLSLFLLTQVTMDLEVLVRIVLGVSHLHGFTNTIAGATLVLVVSVPLGKPVCEWALRWWNRNLSPAQSRWLEVSEKISWKAAWSGGVLGVYSHLILDAIMHADAKPWMPFSEVNSFFGLISADRLDLLCLICLLTGGIIVVIHRVIKGKS